MHIAYFSLPFNSRTHLRFRARAPTSEVGRYGRSLDVGNAGDRQRKRLTGESGERVAQLQPEPVRAREATTGQNETGHDPLWVRAVIWRGGDAYGNLKRPPHCSKPRVRIAFGSLGLAAPFPKPPPPSVKGITFMKVSALRSFCS